MENEITVNQFFKVKITEMREEESANGKIKIKKIKYEYVVYTNNIGNAEKLANNYAKSLFDDYEINAVTDSKIIGIINHHGDLLDA